MLEGKFKIEVIASGQFEDCSFVIHTTVIRLNPDAMNEWLDSSVLNDRYCYEREEEWQAHKERKEANRKEVKNKIAAALGIQNVEDGFTITQNVSEIFTVVDMIKIQTGDDSARERRNS